jgi:hypothetical protein
METKKKVIEHNFYWLLYLDPHMRVNITRADHSGGVVLGMRLRPLEHWDRGFESHSRHGYISAFILCLCCSVCR